MENCHMRSSMTDDMITSKCPIPTCHPFTKQSISAKYGQPDPEKGGGVLEGMDAGRDVSSEEGSGGQGAVSKKANKQA